MGIWYNDWEPYYLISIGKGVFCTMKYAEKIRHSEYPFRGKILNLRYDEVELPNGRIAKREIVEHSGGVCVFALDKNRNLLLVRQYRHPYQEEILELPAGKVNAGENHYDCGKRELEEETGYIPGRYEYFGEIYPSPGYCSEIIRIYYADDLTPTAQHLDEGEFLDVVRMPFPEVLQRVLSGEIKDAKTVAAVLKYQVLYGTK